MSASAAERVRELLEQVNEALALDATVEIEQPEDGVIRATLHADSTSACSSAATARPSRNSIIEHLAYRIAAAARRRIHQRVIVDAAGYASAARPRSRARPTRPPRTRSAPAARSRWTR